MVPKSGGEPSKAPGLRTLLLLGAGELGKEIAISAQRIGTRVIAADHYAGAPAMQVAHVSEVLSLQDAKALEGMIRTHRPDLILPEVETVRAETLRRLEEDGFRIVPSASATEAVVSRETLRSIAHDELGLRVPRYRIVASEEELGEACDELGYPCVVKPISSFSGRGQTVVLGPARVERAWAFAREGGTRDDPRVIAEERIDFHTEVTLVAVREWGGRTTFLPPIAHRQERGDYRESWTPAGLDEARTEALHTMARSVTDRLGGAGVYGLEFFLTDDEVIFSEFSLGPHDTGLVTLISQNLSQFDLHVRAVLGLPVPTPRLHGPAASAVILADREGEVAGYGGIARALQVEETELRIFGKPTAHPFRRMGVALALGQTVDEARSRALEAASRVHVDYA